VSSTGQEMPILFKCATSACTSWTTQQLPLPSGHIQGNARFVHIPQPSGFAAAVAVGSTRDSSGVPKAVAWQPDGLGGFTVTLLGEPTPMPVPASESVSLNYQKIKLSHAATAGLAANGLGERKPVVWFFDATIPAWAAPVVLPLPLGGDEGGATAMAVSDGAPGAQVMSVAGFEDIDDGGTPGTRAIAWQCTTTVSPSADCGSVGAWTSTVLTPLVGQGSSSALDIAILPNGDAAIAGTSYSSGADPYVSGEATLWVVDSSTHAIISTLRVSDMADDLAAGDVPRVLDSFQLSPGDGLGVHAVSGTMLGGAARRWLMTGVPWNRRVQGVALVPQGQGRFDVEVSWRIDLAGNVLLDTELGATVELEIGGVPEADSDNPECIIWDIKDSDGYSCDVLPDGANCGTATLNTVPVGLTCDGGTGTCGLGFTTVFADVAVSAGEAVSVTLTPSPLTEPETVVDDDFFQTIATLPVPTLGATGIVGLGALILTSGWFLARRPLR
jgi:hypothetical protein